MFNAGVSDKKYDTKTLKVKFQIPTAAKDAIYDATKAQEIGVVSCVGIMPMTVWVINPEGQTGRCDTYVDVQNNMGATPKSGNCAIKSSGICFAPNIRNVNLEFGSCAFSIFDTELSYSASLQSTSKKTIIIDNPFKFMINKFCMPLDSFLHIDLAKKNTNYLYGISTFDMVMLSKHILGKEIIKDSFAQQMSWNCVN
jgi:hypothetical protein